jgi:hypothetical protein
MSTRGKAFFVGLRDALQNSDLGSIAFADQPPFWDVNLVMAGPAPGVYRHDSADPDARRVA